MEDKGTKFLKDFLFILIVTPLASLLNGVIVQDLWEWFVLPVFTNMPTLTLGQSIGLAIIVGYMCKYIKVNTTEEENNIPNSQIAFVATFYTLFVWGYSYIVHCFIS